MSSEKIEQGETEISNKVREIVHSTIDSVSHVNATFQEVFDHFLNFAEKVLQYNISGELILASVNNQSNAIQASLNNYRKVYNKTRESSKHIEKFTEIYIKCRAKFLQDIDLDTFMDWFRSTSFIISPQEKSRSKILLTAIFRNCCRIAEHISDEADRNPERADQLYNDPAAMYPEMFMLHLFRIFYYCADETDRTTMINQRIDDIEETLGLTKDQIPSSGDGLRDLFSAATEMAQSIGINVPKSVAPMTGGQFRDAIKTITQDPQTRAAMKDIFTDVDLNDPSNVPGAIGKILQRMQENAKRPPDAVQKSLKATSDTS